MSEENNYIGNQNTKVYHHVGCHYTKMITPNHQIELDYEHVKDGFRACTKCSH